jgi:hypothetical protein
MAARRLSNVEIAQALRDAQDRQIHLGNAYSKLRLKPRADLTLQLSDEGQLSRHAATCPG